MGYSDDTSFTGTERFALRRRLGEGGMGIVYEAYDNELKTYVALKTLRRAEPSAVARLRKEFRALRGLEHPNLVGLGELLESDGEHFFTMELVDGVDFLAHVRCGEKQAEHAPYDEPKLRDALRQLADGIAALHRADRVHRDIKPSNVLVTEAGRVVLLDFGLAKQPTPERLTSATAIAGTAEYMAPEQALTMNVGPAADWYSLGVILYQALTGHLPHSGKTTFELLQKKQVRTPPPPRQRFSGVPEDLDELCVELLRVDPERRPAGHEILERLGVEDSLPSTEPSGTSMAAFTQTTPFVGREQELALLREAFDRCREGAAVTVFVHGESGLGKSELVREFCHALAAENRRVLVLAGRCYEREQVSFNAFAGVARALSRHLQEVPETDAARVLPPRAGLLPSLFPILQQVKAIAEAPLQSLSALDPQERRTRMFHALRDLLVGVAEHSDVILAIDDLQWVDADSLALLREIMHPSDAPNLFLLGTARPGVEELLAETVSGDVHHLHLGELPPEQARDLVAQLAPRMRDEQARSIAEEAAGHPLFILELVRHLDQQGTTAHLRLDEALWLRVSALDEHPRKLLELLAVAGAPVTQRVAALAAGLSAADCDKAVRILRVAFLARTGSRRAGVVEPYHDRVREAVLAHLDRASHRRHHRELAVALERAGAATSDPQALVRHFAAGEEPERAAKHADAAAARASAMSAFDQAAELLETALELGQHEPDEARELRRRLGEALVNAGRAAEAAEVFLQAASEADEQTTLELRVRAGSEFLRSGHVDEGVEVLRPALAAAGVQLARSPTGAALSFLFGRLYTRLRGLSFRARSPAQVSPETLTRIDAYHAAATGLAMIDTVRGAYAQTRHLLTALRRGDEFRVGRALSFEASFLCLGGPRTRPRVDRSLATLREIADRLEDPYLTGSWHMGMALAAYHRGEWKATLEHAQGAETTFRDQCQGASYELMSGQLYGLWAQYWLGDFLELGRRVTQLLRTARERGDEYTMVCLMIGIPSFSGLVADDPRETHDRIEEATARWTPRGYHLQHYWAGFALIQCDLYAGDPVAACERADAQWTALRKAFLLRLSMIRVEMLHLRARCALAAALTTDDRKRYLRLASKLTRRLEREPLAWCLPAAALLRAGIFNATDRADRAAVLLEEAEQGLRAADTHALAEAAKRARGVLVGGDRGRALIEESERWMAEQGVVNPARMARFFAPGFETDAE